MFLVSWERKQYWLNTMEPPVVVLKQRFEVAMVPPLTGTGLPLSKAFLSLQLLHKCLILFKR